MLKELPTPKQQLPKGELFYVERLLFPLVQLGGSFANDVQGESLW